MDTLDALYGADKIYHKKKRKDKKKLEYISNPLLYKKGTPNITFLIDYYLSTDELNGLKNYLNYSGIRHDFQILYCLKYKIREEIKTEITKFYRENKIALEEYIPENTKVVSIGRSLFAINESDVLNISGFQDLLLFQTSYFSPDYKIQVFPVDSYQRIMHTSNSPYNKFFDIQLEFLTEDYSFETEKVNKVYLGSKGNEWLTYHIGKDCVLALDTETNTLNSYSDIAQITDITFSFDGKTGYHIPWEEIDLEILNEFLKGKKLVGANIKFDCRFLHLLGDIPLDNLDIFWDTVNISKVINELQFNALKSDAYIYTRHGGYDKELERYLHLHPKAKKDYSLIPSRLRKPYAVMDVIVAYQVYEAQCVTLKKLDSAYPNNDWSLDRFVREIRLPSINNYLKVEIDGVYINKEELITIGNYLQKEIIDSKKKIYECFNIEEKELNLDSTEALGKFIENKLGWTVFERSKKGICKTGSDFLDKWIKEDREGASLLSELRGIQTLFKTFIGVEGIVHSDVEKLDALFNMDDLETLEDDQDESGMWKFLTYHEEDDSYRIHPQFFVMMTDSGTRNRTKDPNSQNWPAHGKKAKLIRKIFTCLKDFVLAGIDYAGLQLRIGAILSGDEKMREIFTSDNPDLHSLTAWTVFRSDITFKEFMQGIKDEVEEFENYRQKAKAVNFQLEFGASAFSFATSTLVKDWSKEDAYLYVIENGLEEVVEKRYKILTSNKDKDQHEMYKDIHDPESFAFYWAIASDIRNKFFENYSGLASFLEESVDFAVENGYARSYHGMFRRLPYLHLALGFKSKSKNIDMALIKNLKNISINTKVQNFEGVIVNRWTNKLANHSKEHNLKSRMFTQIHDSGDYYIYKPEIKEFCTIAKKIGETDYPEYKGIPIELEGKIADYHKGELWDVKGMCHPWNNYLE